MACYVQEQDLIHLARQVAKVEPETVPPTPHLNAGLLLQACTPSTHSNAQNNPQTSCQVGIGTHTHKRDGKPCTLRVILHT